MIMYNKAIALQHSQLAFTFSCTCMQLSIIVTHITLHKMNTHQIQTMSKSCGKYSTVISTLVLLKWLIRMSIQDQQCQRDSNKAIVRISKSGEENTESQFFTSFITQPMLEAIQQCSRLLKYIICIPPIKCCCFLTCNKV